MRRVLRFSAAIALLGLTLGGARWASGQAPQFPTPQQRDAAPTVISGNDIGFRVDAQATKTQGKLTGTWVVRINGQWIEPEPLRMSRPLGTN